MALPILGLLGSLFGIGKGVLERKSKLKELKQIQGHEIVKAETKAVVDRILNNTESDNSIDLITAKNKKYTLKDEVVTYLFLTPVFIAAITPFIMAFDNGSWTKLNEYTKQSWQSLNELPEWYMYVLIAVVVDVLGFRSFMRKLIDKWSSKFSINK
tara:strand:- start:7897 stop:8364 length:468 start_codon:yes stop_codon:yes gene_type:complete